MLVKRMGYGVRSSRTGLTVNVFVSLAGASRVCSAGEAPDRVSCVMRLVANGLSRAVVSCQPSRASKPLLELLADVVDATCVRFVPTPAGRRRHCSRASLGSARRGHTPRSATTRRVVTGSSPRGPAHGASPSGLVAARCSGRFFVDLFRSHSLKSARDTPLHASGAIDTSDGTSLSHVDDAASQPAT